MSSQKSSRSLSHLLMSFCWVVADVFSNTESPLNFAQYTVLPNTIEIVMWPQITVTLLHPLYTAGRSLLFAVHVVVMTTLCGRAGNGSLWVTHNPSDPLSSWPMTHGSPGPSPHTSASLTQIYGLPGAVFGHCICTHTFKLLHNCTCKQTSCWFYFWLWVSLTITVTFYKEINKIKVQDFIWFLSLTT